MQKLAFSLTEARTSTRSRSPCCRRSPTSARCRRWSTATSSRIAYGAQDLSAARLAAPTPARSRPRCSPSSAARYVVVGHSERRQYHGEDDAHGQREGEGGVPARAHADPVRRRGPRGPPGGGAPSRTRSTSSTGRSRASPPSRRRTIVVAYEPVWAIGTGEVATPEDAQEVCAAIRAAARRALLRRPSPTRVRVLYGGSVKGSQRRRRSWRSPTSTARWSAAPASTPRSSSRIVPLRGDQPVD